MKIKMARVGAKKDGASPQMRASVGLGSGMVGNPDPSSVKDTIEEIVLKDNGSQCRRKASFKSFALGTERAYQDIQDKQKMHDLEATATQGISDENLKKYHNASA